MLARAVATIGVLLICSAFAAGRGIVSVTFTPDTVVGGAPSTGTVTLDGPAGPSGTNVGLSVDVKTVSIPKSVMVPAGQTSVTFTAATSPVSDQAVANITAAADGTKVSGVLTLTPVALASVAVNIPAVLQGSVAELTVTLSGPASKGGTLVALTSTAKETPVPANIKIESGQTSATLKIPTKFVENPVTSTITASLGFIDATATLTVNPIGPASVSLNPPTINGKGTAVGTVTLYGPAATPMTIQLGGACRTAIYPSTVKIEAGQSSATFPVSTTFVPATQPITVTAKFGSVLRTTVLSVLAPTIASTVFNPPAVMGGQPSEGTVTLSFAAPPGGMKIVLSSDMPSTIVPDSIFIPEGKTTGTFKVRTEPTAAPKPANIRSIVNGAGPTIPLTIQPPVLTSFHLGPLPSPERPHKPPVVPAGTNPAAPPAPAAQTPPATSPDAPPIVTGSNSIEGTISLGTPSPVDGIEVTLTSSDKCAIVPPRATIAGGRLSVKIKVRTTKVKSETPVTLTATWNGVSVSATLKVK